MSNFKYPYISDKKLYAATMYACKMIRENGYRNKAIQIASDTYGFDFEEVEAEVIKRQSAGKKAKHTPKKYKWYIVEEYEEHTYRDEYIEHIPNPQDFKVIRALNLKNANKTSEPYGWGTQNESYSTTNRFVYKDLEFSTKKEAQKYLDSIIGDIEKNYNERMDTYFNAYSNSLNYEQE